MFLCGHCEVTEGFLKGNGVPLSHSRACPVLLLAALGTLQMAAANARGCWRLRGSAGRSSPSGIVTRACPHLPGLLLTELISTASIEPTSLGTRYAGIW